MTDKGAVTSKCMVNVPSGFWKRCGIRAGDRLASVEQEDGILLIRIPPLEMFGSGGAHGHAFLKIARELETDRRREARAER